MARIIANFAAPDSEHAEVSHWSANSQNKSVRSEETFARSDQARACSSQERTGSDEPVVQVEARESAFDQTLLHSERSLLVVPSEGAEFPAS